MFRQKLADSAATWWMNNQHLIVSSMVKMNDVLRVRLISINILMVDLFLAVGRRSYWFHHRSHRRTQLWQPVRAEVCIDEVAVSLDVWLCFPDDVWLVEEALVGDKNEELILRTEDYIRIARNPWKTYMRMNCDYQSALSNITGLPDRQKCVDRNRVRWYRFQSWYTRTSF